MPADVPKASSLRLTRELRFSIFSMLLSSDLAKSTQVESGQRCQEIEVLNLVQTVVAHV